MRTSSGILGITILAAIWACSDDTSPTAAPKVEGASDGGAPNDSGGGGDSSPQPDKDAAAVDAGPHACPPWPAFPTAACTGFIPGTTLTNVDAITTSSAGQVIGKMNVAGDIAIEHDDVTIENTKVLGRIYMNGHKGLSLTDVDLGADACPPATSDFRSIVGDAGYHLLRVHVHHNNGDLLSIGGGDPVVIEDSLLDQTCFYAGDHLDAVQWCDPGGKGTITLHHNRIDGRPVNSSDRGNSAVFFADGAAKGTTVTADQNLFAGGNFSTSLYDAVAGSEIVLDFHDNQYVKDSYAIAPCSFGASVKSIAFDGTSGVKFAGNTLDDGTPVTCD